VVGIRFEMRISANSNKSFLTAFFWQTKRLWDKSCGEAGVASEKLRI
jgi:hypothetical protein